MDLRSPRALCALVVLSLLAPCAMAQTPVYAEGGYADRHSVVAGETIAFHIATTTSPFALNIVNLAHPATVLQTISGLISAANDCTGKWENGCGWPVTTQFTVPSNWTPGYYAVDFPTSRGTRRIIFVVRAATPGSYAPIVIIQSTNTYVAYNQFGGKSVYDTRSTNNQRAHIVSFLRPYEEDGGLSRYRMWEQQFVDWMTTEGRAFEVITDDDVDAGVPLSAYNAVLLVGHSEYWTLTARQHLAAFQEAGGHIAIFAGNTMWWQARLDLAAQQMTVYKNATLDPQNGVNNQIVTVNWFDWPVFNPENLLVGASFRNAGYANKQPDPSFDPLPPNERTPYTVRSPSSWVFAGTGVVQGSQIAQASGGIEVDGALFNTLPDGSVVVEGSDGTPLSSEILATLPARDGYTTITLHTHPNGGAVFNTGTRDWSLGLATDAVVQQMTRNVLDRFATGDPFAYAPRVTPNRVEDRFNTPSPPSGVIPGWSLDPMAIHLSAQCAHEGPTGLELTGTAWTTIERSFAVSPTGLSTAQFNLWLNADLLQDTPDFAVPVIDLANKQGPTESDVASLEIKMRFDGLSVRVSTFGADDSVITASTPWIVLTPGWHSVRVSWTSPGTVELNVSGTRVTAFNPTSGQSANLLEATFTGSNIDTIGSICVDELQLRNTFAPPSASTSEITVSPASIEANGTSTSTITVQLKDADGNDIINGGDTVTLSTNRGTLSAITDLGDGRYRATLTSSTSPGNATITANVNTAPFANNATVTFTPVILPAPSSIDASAINTSTVAITWSPVPNAASYVIERSSNGNAFAPIATPQGTSYHDSDLAAGTSFLYRVYALDASNNPGDNSAIDVATTIQFTDDPSHRIRAVDFTNLRAAIDTFRDSANLPAATYTNAIVVGAIVRAIDLTEMRTAVNAARTAAGLPPFPYSEAINVGTPIRILHLHELQSAIGAIPGG